MIIQKYLLKEIFAVFLACTIVLLLIFMSNQFIQYINAVVEGRLTAHLVKTVLLLKMPLLLGILMPLSLFLAILLSYGRLYADSEMTVLFASGFSFAKLTKVTLMFAFMVMVIISILVFWISPGLSRYADDLLQKGAVSPLELISAGRFQSVQNGQWVFYTQNISNDHEKLNNIFVVDQRLSDTGVGGILSAESGRQWIDPITKDLFLIFNNGSRYVGIPGQKNYEIINFKDYGIRIGENQNVLQLKEDAISTRDLFQNHKENKILAELEWRFSMPIMAFILALMAIPLSRIKTKKGRYTQLVPAVLFYIVYGNFMFLGHDWLADGKISRMIGMWWVHILMLIVAAILIVRQVGWARFWSWLGK